jgi:hypothetical protein
VEYSPTSSLGIILNINIEKMHFLCIHGLKPIARYWIADFNQSATMI